MRHADWTVQRFFHNGDDYFREMLQHIREARKTIYLETYIFAIDSLTRMVLEELRKARERGVDVRIIVDGFGSYFWLDALAKHCQRDDLDLRVWEPLPRGVSSFRQFLIPLRFRMIALFRKLNRRDHRKMTLIDGKRVFMGSLNLTQVHCDSFMGALGWRDTGVLLEGESVQDLTEVYETTWKLIRKPSMRFLRTRMLLREKYNPHESRIRLNQSRRDRRALRKDLLFRIYSARTRVAIASAYFLPTRSILIALRNAAERGVKVDVIMPGVSDVPLVKWAAAGVSKLLLNWGVQIFEYQGRMLHAKYCLVDDWALVGSANFNHRSLFHDLEVEAVFEKPESVLNLAEQYAKDTRHSRALTLEILAQRSFLRRCLDAIAFRLRYIL